MTDLTEDGMIEKAWLSVQGSDIWRHRSPTPREVTAIAVRYALSALPIPLTDLLAVVNGKSVIVPVEPTEAMKGAVNWGASFPGLTGPAVNADVYRAMIEARPK